MTLPVILLPVDVDEVALDTTLAALDASTPAGTLVWLADDAQGGPRVQQVIAHWREHTALQAEYTRRDRPVGQVQHLEQMLQACGDADVVVLAADAVPLPGWFQQLVSCFSRDASIASATPWCNAGETVAWPRRYSINPLPADRTRLALACAALPPMHPELPSALPHAVLLRGSARRKVGGLDINSYSSWYAALVDLSLRMSGMGWRNVLCETAFVGCMAEPQAREGDLDALAARWPSWTPRLAAFLMEDPLQSRRQQLQDQVDRTIMTAPQGDLFDARVYAALQE